MGVAQELQSQQADQVERRNRSTDSREDEVNASIDQRKNEDDGNTVCLNTDDDGW